MPRLVVVANRIPTPRRGASQAGGLAVALREARLRRELLWFGWSGEIAEAPACSARLSTRARASFAQADLAPAEYRGFYRGYANGMLWPLLHFRLGLAEFRRDEFVTYRGVNERFARLLAPLLRADDTVWVHDYHLIPFGAALRRLARTGATPWAGRLGFFLHVPLPPPALFTALPQADWLLADFAAYDLVGVQTRQDAGFLTEMLDARDIRPRIGVFPAGIDPEGQARTAREQVQGPEARRLAESLGRRALILGIDRLDYSKGLPERLRGFEQVLRRFPEHRDRVTMLQIAPVSRGDVSQYRALRRELDELAGRINAEYAEFDGLPLRYLTRGLARSTLAGFQRLARVGLVTPLRDGMNLVAKEYVASQDPEDPGVLVLSRFAGAADDLDAALLVNPHDPDEIAEAIAAALAMGAEERRTRWQALAAAVTATSAARWAQGFLAALEQG